MTKQNCKQLIEHYHFLLNQIKESVIECLTALNATSRESALEFDWENSDAPSIASTNFHDDLADAYVTAIWLDNGLVKVDLHAYYLGDDIYDINLNDECNVDWDEILDYVSDNLDD